MPEFEDPASESSDPHTLRDAVTRWWYTLVPQTYVDETSDVSELLWNQFLEQRAVRGWLTVIAVLVAVSPLLAVTLYLILR